MVTVSTIYADILVYAIGKEDSNCLSNENKGRNPCAVRLSSVTSMLNTMTAYKKADEKLIAKHLKNVVSGSWIISIQCAYLLKKKYSPPSD